MIRTERQVSASAARKPRRAVRFAILLVAIPFAGGLRPVTAQQRSESESDRAPRFLLEAAHARIPVDLARSPSLRRAVTLELNGVPFTDAIAELSRRSGMTIVFSNDVVAGDTPVDLHVRSLSVAAVLTELLLDKSLDVVMRPDGSAALVRRPPSPPPPMVGSVSGRVTEANTGVPVVGAAVAVE